MDLFYGKLIKTTDFKNGLIINLDAGKVHVWQRGQVLLCLRQLFWVS